MSEFSLNPVTSNHRREHLDMPVLLRKKLPAKYEYKIVEMSYMCVHHHRRCHKRHEKNYPNATHAHYITAMPIRQHTTKPIVKFGHFHVSCAIS